jgi:hypothetical protein
MLDFFMYPTYLKQENGDFLLLETGDKIILENLTYSSITKSLHYEVTPVYHTITKSASYDVQTSHPTTKSLRYDVHVSGAISKSITYAVKTIHSVTKSSAYRVPLVIYPRSKTDNTNTGSSLTLTKPAGTIPGDILVVVIGINSNETITRPAGWGNVNSRGDGTNNLYVYRHSVDGSEGANFTFTTPGSNIWIGSITAWVNVQIPTSVTSATIGNASSNTVTWAQLTTTIPYSTTIWNSMLIGTGTINTPAGMALWDNSSGTPNSINTSYFVKDVIGATGVKTTTIVGGGSLASIGISFEFKPQYQFPITKNLIYKVRAPVDVTKSAKYTVRKAQTAITKSDKYTISTLHTDTKGLIYKVEPFTHLTKTLSYGITGHPIVPVSLTYEVHTTPSAKTKSLGYFILLHPAVITKSLGYKVQPSTDHTKGLEYTVLYGGTIPESLQYTIQSPVNKPLSLKYCVPSTSSQTKSDKYTILRVHPITKGLVYKIVYEAPYSKGLKYCVYITPAAITKSVGYFILTIPAATTKVLHYEVIPTFGLNKSLTYAILITTATYLPVKKRLDYRILYLGETIELYHPQNTSYNSYNYRNRSHRTKTKSLTYAVV